jgi:hypothetical protein
MVLFFAIINEIIDEASTYQQGLKMIFGQKRFINFTKLAINGLAEI